MTIQEQINSFYRFATDHVARGSVETSLDELFDQWRFSHLDSDEVSENVAAIQSAIDDMHQGDIGRDAEEIETELRRSLHLPADKSVEL